MSCSGFVQRGEGERDRLVEGQFAPLFPRFGEGCFVELAPDCSERLLVHPGDPGLADTDLLLQALEARKELGGYVRFPEEPGENVGRATEALGYPVGLAELAHEQQVLPDQRERVIDAALVEGNDRQ